MSRLSFVVIAAALALLFIACGHTTQPVQPKSELQKSIRTSSSVVNATGTRERMAPMKLVAVKPPDAVQQFLLVDFANSFCYKRGCEISDIEWLASASWGVFGDHDAKMLLDWKFDVVEGAPKSSSSSRFDRSADFEMQVTLISIDGFTETFRVRSGHGFGEHAELRAMWRVILYLMELQPRM